MTSIKHDTIASEPADISLEELANIYGGSGMVGAPAPKPRKQNNTSGSSGSGSGSTSEPYSPPVSIPNIPSEPLYMFDPGPMGFGDGGGGY